jgi:SWI/SNF-related matrix-associated actin-dependent regulator of chromatin subfamily B protein 1
LGLCDKAELITRTALAHDIHEQIITQKRCLFLTGHIVGSGLDLDDEVKTAFLPPIRNVLRNEHIAMSTYTPIFATFTDEDIQTIERERERDSKRKKRATRARRGVILPDREPVKTQRTLLNPIGANGVIAQAATELASAAPVTSSRRAAAIAAQANINLLAQDLPLPQPPTPPSTNHPYKTTKSRGRGSGRGGYSRNSPASFPTREGSVLGDHHTPMPSSALKRSHREQTGSEINSPAPNKMARVYHPSSPTLVNESQSNSQAHSQIKMEQPSFQAPPPTISGIPQSTSMGEIKRKTEDLIDPRDTKSAKLDPMLGQGHGPFDSNPQSRSDSPSSISFPPIPKQDQKRFMPSSPSSSDSGSESSDSDYGAPKKSKPLGNKTQKSITPASIPLPTLNPSPQFSSSPTVSFY